MTIPARIAVLGAGLMGHGIAQVFAAGGHQVKVYDQAPDTLASLQARIAASLVDVGGDPACASLVEGTPDLGQAVATSDFIVEAVLEDLSIKQDLLARVEALAESNAIIASNTSVMPITSIMRKLSHRGRALGTHWWNPPYLIPLVEVIGTEWTNPEVISSTIRLLSSLGKTAVHVKKDVPGFIGNRLQHALWREAISLVEHGICDAETVDTVVKASFGRRLGVLGPLENADLVGTDLTLAIHRTVLPAIDGRHSPSPLLEQLVQDGQLGMKSGRGFRDWTGDAGQRRAQDVRTALKRQLKREETATPDQSAE